MNYITKIQRELDSAPDARLEEGIKRIRDRYLENKEWMDGGGKNI